VTGVFRGVGVSPGVAVGRALPWEPSGEPQPQRRPRDDSHPKDELRKLDAARESAREELRALKARLMTTLGESYAAILDAQALLVDDPALMTEVEHRIRVENDSASFAVHATIEAYLARFESIEDTYLRDRAGDLRDLQRRLVRLLEPVPGSDAPPPDGPIVVVAQAVGPSDTVALARDGVVALAADLGGPTSHTAILAQAFGLPAVIGLGDVARGVRVGAIVVVDGDRGEVVVDPDPSRLVEARARHDAWITREDAWAASRDVPAVTKDGVEIIVRANVEFPDEAAVAVRFGARGIGLYRSEFLFVARAPRLPDEDDHYRTYRDLAARVAPHPVVVRTLDLGGEKYFHEVLDRAEPNPVLGLRGLRLCLKRPELFVPQLRALLRASAHANLRVLLPLVTSVEEVREVRRILGREAAALRDAGVLCRPDVPLGAMIETPAAAMTADLLAREVDFLSIGTNDLIQYALAVDRGNPTVAGLYEPLHPAVLRMLRFVVRAGKAANVRVSLCGEMAAAPDLVPTLLGLGLRELSCPPRAVPRVREAIRATDLARAVREIEEKPA
jgi:phosphoenolpyruvate-protein phosphotransferase (PTS system enzyme I)